MDCGFVFGESFHEDVCHHFFGWAIFHSDLFLSNCLSNEMIPYVNVLSTSVVIVVFCKVEHGLVVTVQGGGSGRGAEQWFSEPVEPNALLCCVHCSHIFGLGCGKSDQLLFA